jgi:ribonuclease P/MRP protein subunit RPP1
MTNRIIINGKNFDVDRTAIRKAHKESQNKEIVYSSADDELNRKILEKEKVDILLLSQKGRKDKLKQRDSGFNHVLAKIAKANNVKIGIDFDEIVNEVNLIDKARILSRIKQNIKLCNKNKLKMIFIVQKEQNERNIYDLKSLGIVLGMPTWML